MDMREDGEERGEEENVDEELEWKERAESLEREVEVLRDVVFFMKVQ